MGLKGSEWVLQVSPSHRCYPAADEGPGRNDRAFTSNYWAMSIGWRCGNRDENLADPDVIVSVPFGSWVYSHQVINHILLGDPPLERHATGAREFSPTTVRRQLTELSRSLLNLAERDGRSSYLLFTAVQGIPTSRSPSRRSILSQVRPSRFRARRPG